MSKEDFITVLGDDLNESRRSKDEIGLARWITLGHQKTDTYFVKQSKAILTSFLIFFSIFATIFILDSNRPPMVHMMDGIVIVVSVVILIVLHLTKSLNFAFSAVVCSGYAVMFLFFLMIGNRGADFMMPLIFPLLAIVVVGPRKSQKWMVLYILMLFTACLIDPHLPQLSMEILKNPSNPSGSIFQADLKRPLDLASTILGVINALIIYGIVYAAYAQMIHARKIVKRQRVALAESYEKSENLLLNILPESVANRLKEDPNTTIADDLDDVVILFADIVDFTKTSANLPASEVVALLNKVFSAFDQLVKDYKLEKIKTSGDAYMVAAGIGEKNADDLERIANLSLDMLTAVDRLNKSARPEIAVRIGVHSGLATAGVVGTLKFYYDIWGDTVNLAARLQTSAKPGSICVSELVYGALKSSYRFETRDLKELKGKGQVQSYKLLGRQH